MHEDIMQLVLLGLSSVLLCENKVLQYQLLNKLGREDGPLFSAKSRVSIGGPECS